jgi:hypothetical protein
MGVPPGGDQSNFGSIKHFDQSNKVKQGDESKHDTRASCVRDGPPKLLGGDAEEPAGETPALLRVEFFLSEGTGNSQFSLGETTHCGVCDSPKKAEVASDA